MLYVNLKPLEPSHFPDGTQMLLDFKVYTSQLRNQGVCTEIFWRYENDEECMTLYYLVNHIREHDPEAQIVLTMHYLPNARMDRTKNAKEVFTLKYFCKFINDLGFLRVRVLDPHSDVGVALLDRVEVMKDSLEMYLDYAINKASEDCEDEDFLVYFPDAGAMKRYRDLKSFKRIKMVYGQKVRNWETGKIEGLEIMDQDGHALTGQILVDVETTGLNGEEYPHATVAKALEGKTVLMVDDIISYGGTLYFSAKKLKELGAEHIFAYATHTENSVLDPEKGTFLKCLEDGTVDMLFTTSSIYDGKHPKIDKLG